MIQEIVQTPTVPQPAHSHTVIALWVLIALSIAQGITLWIILKARGGWTYIATIPFVNLRQLVSLVLAVVTIVGSGLVGYFSGVWPPEHVYEGALVAITAWMGLDITQYWVKRRTVDPTLASTQNVMAQQQAAGTRVDARTAMRQTAEMPIPVTQGDRPDLTDHDRGII